MSLESFYIIDQDGTKHYMGDYGIYIGSQNTGLWKGDFVADSEDYAEKVNGMDGQYFFNKAYREQKSSIPCFVENITEDQKLKVQKIFTFRKPKKLILDRYKYRYRNIIIDGKIDWDEIWYGAHYSSLFEISYVAYDPFWYSYYSTLDNTYEYYDLHSIFGNTNLLPSDVPSCIIENIVSTKSLELFNHGNIEAKPIITIYGAGTNITINNTSTSQICTITGISSQIVTIDCKKGIVRSNDLLYTDAFDGDFIELESGYNDLVISGDSLNLQYVSFDYRHTYI